MMISNFGLTLKLKRVVEENEKLAERNRVLENTLRAAYIALKKHENLDVDIVGEAMGILEERAWSNE